MRLIAALATVFGTALLLCDPAAAGPPKKRTVWHGNNVLAALAQGGKVSATASMKWSDFKASPDYAAFQTECASPHLSKRGPTPDAHQMVQAATYTTSSGTHHYYVIPTTRPNVSVVFGEHDSHYMCELTR